MHSSRLLSSALTFLVLAFTALLLLAGSSPAAAAEPGKGKVLAVFAGSDLTGFRVPLADWQVAKAVSLSATNEKVLAIKAGKGVLVNGPKRSARQSRSLR